ncbi:6-phosphogluconolactonase [Aminobacter aminovorans]|uniref:6-phosphogluconolactonase n=1 Tax=Aminobacter aminovorans TaxID=83263 RepID=A0A380WRC4_AMIAI|nr:6-phosphogluconolactonase [Aminobacter aminovorans]TCS30532.1 6-phosphogluconolactonase [Aminobacter aminovorans]SUU91381.1 6-phosphogluconolactonase [Aminobacter aminovorans]
MAAPRWNAFETRDELASALAARVADTLKAAIARRGVAFLAVSGGTTPGRFFAALSKEALDWSKVTVTLVDERFVPESSPRSNAALAKANLLQNAASAARFAPLFHEAATVEKGADLADSALRALPWPLDVSILGMGGDGHTASFFPDAAGLDALLDPASSRLAMPVHADSAGEPRLTLTLPALVSAALVVVHIEGAEKRRVIEAALASDKALPIRTVIDRAPRATEIYWAP